MALIECPECKKKISDKASACPHCGYDLVEVKKKKEEENINKGCAIGCFITILIFVFIAIANMICDKSTGNSNLSSGSQNSSENQILSKLRGTDIYDFSIDGGFIKVHFDISDNLSNDMIKGGAKMDIMFILKAIDEVSPAYTQIEIFGRYPLVDRYGNTEEEIVLKTTYSKENISDINWSSFSWENVYIIADDVYIHPAFQ